MKKILNVIGIASFLLMFGIVGGMECGTIPVLTGAILSALSLATWTFVLWKTGVIR